jgi:hypothetical protein
MTANHFPSFPALTDTVLPHSGVIVILWFGFAFPHIPASVFCCNTILSSMSEGSLIKQGFFSWQAENSIARIIKSVADFFISKMFKIISELNYFFEIIISLPS